jgi:hypothetical protein
MSGTTFYERTIPHDELLRSIVKDLQCWGFQVIENGREHTAPGATLGDDPGALMLRMRPDIAFLFNRKTIFADVKASDKIERKPYEEYMFIVKRGAPVIVIAHKSNDTRFCRLIDLEFRNPYHPVWPIVEGWIAPREHPRYAEYKFNYPLTPGRPYRGSGTPYREFDFDTMNPWGPMYLPWVLNNQI